MAKIPVLDLKPGIDSLWTEISDAMRKVIDGTEFINGPIVKEFEGNVARYLGVKHAVGLNSGTDALTIGLRALGIGPGDEVITTPFTFYATVEAIQLLGATPVLVDIRPDTFNLDEKLLASAVTPRTKAIIPVHLFGHGCDMRTIMGLAKERGIKVLEDNAQAFSGEMGGEKLGAIGDAGALSFFPSKNLGAFGDAGMLVTNDEAVADAARMLRAHGSRKKYHNEAIGYNSRLDSLQAAVLNVKLSKIDESTEGRRDVARRYRDFLRDFPGIDLPVELPGARHCYHQYTVRVRGGKRDRVQAKLQEDGVSTMVYYPIPIHELPVFRGVDSRFPESEKAAKEVLSLPIWPEMSADVQGQVAEALKRVLG